MERIGTRGGLFAFGAYCRAVLLTVVSILACYHVSVAQFTIIDDLRGNNYPDIVLGGPGHP